MIVHKMLLIFLICRTIQEKARFIGEPNVHNVHNFEFASVYLLQHSVRECLVNGSSTKCLVVLNFVWKPLEAVTYDILHWLYSCLRCKKGSGNPWTLLWQLLKGFNTAADRRLTFPKPSSLLFQPLIFSDHYIFQFLLHPFSVLL